MILIFKGFNVKTFVAAAIKSGAVSKFCEFAKANRIKIKYTALSVTGVAVVIATLLLSGVTVGVKVNYSGKNIAVVKNEAVFKSALKLATENISDEEAQKAIETPKFSLTLTVSDRLQNAENLANSIIENTDDIEYATALKVNGEISAVVKGDTMKDYLERRRTSYYVEGAQNTASFVASVEIAEGYYLKSQIVDFSDAKTVIDGLEVKTVSVTETKVEIPYKTIKKTTSEQTVGYSKVTTAGCNGTSIKTVSSESINGTVVSTTELSNEVISNPVDKVVVVGTAVAKVSATQRAETASSGFICPLNKGKFSVSAYYGDGRNHKGIDLAASRGTPIFAAGGGTVTHTGYDSDYGYNVIIQHSNGISTRYAHASALCVSKGQVVSQGDMIATVGSTGYSTGNHLHFEVIVNGTRVNPAAYIGL